MRKVKLELGRKKMIVIINSYGAFVTLNAVMFVLLSFYCKKKKKKLKHGKEHVLWLFHSPLSVAINA